MAQLLGPSVAGTASERPVDGVEDLQRAAPGVFIGLASTLDQTPGIHVEEADAQIERTGSAPAEDHDGPVEAEDVVPATPTPVITSRTDMRAPDGSPDTRTTVGIGEVVYFSLAGGAEAEWTATAGFPRHRDSRSTFAWELGDPGSATITATLAGGQSATIDMRSVLPSSLRMQKFSEDPPGTTGTANAGMQLRPRFGPRSVSFGNAAWLEVGRPATNLSGYFQTQVANGTNLTHVPNPDFLRIGPDLSDHAAAFGFPQPYGVGTWDWVIPNRFKRTGTDGNGHFGFDSLQTFRMDGTGAITVAKQGASVTKAPIP